MRPIREGIAVLLVCTAACSSPAKPEPPVAPAGHAGEWTGTTAQGTAVSFSVAGDAVTSFTLTFTLSPTCSGTVTVPGPVPIVMQVPPGPPPFDQPGFARGINGPNSEWGIAVTGAFSPDRWSASGQFQLVVYPGCGTVGGTWTAKRR